MFPPEVNPWQNTVLAMICYSVVVTVGKDLSKRFEDYMRSRHIPDVLAAGKFEGASFARSEDGSYRVSYMAPDRKSLEDYLSEDSARMRELFAREFPFEVSATREVLEVIDAWEPDRS